ncbi:hypothetical protein [Paraclostridium dentum]|uniref:hypothetical protein n=1 Tax=Paraclostridium dentum TaxID=2662455 RepID=UPI003F3DE04D
MNVLVKQLNERQKAERAEIKAKQQMERRALGERIVVDVIQGLTNDLKALGCEDLIASIGTGTEVEASKQIVNNITIKKGKVIKLPGEPQAVKDITEIEIHLDTIASQKKEIEALKKSVATWQSKAAKLEKDMEKAIKEALANNIKEEEKETVNNTPEDISFNEEEYLYLQQLDEQLEAEIAYHEEPVIEPVIENISNVLATGVKEIAFNSKNKEAKLFETKECFFLTSTHVKEITIMPKYGYKVTDELRKSLEELMIEKLGFRSDRRTLSPITVSKENGYFARIDAVKGPDKFSNEDKFGGFVTISGMHFMWTWQPAKHDAPVIKDLNKLVSGQKTGVTNSLKAKIEPVILLMQKEYQIELDKLVAEQTSEQDELIRKNNAMKAKDNKKKQEMKAKYEAAQAKLKAKKEAEAKKTNVVQETPAPQQEDLSMASSFSRQARANMF